jgi:MoxR-like ATPase
MGPRAELLPRLGSRVLVVGSGGAGKSTVSRIIADHTGLPVIPWMRIIGGRDGDRLRCRTGGGRYGS